MGYLQGISRKVHWFVLTNYDRPDRTSIVVPYIEMTWLSGSRGLDQFIREITADMAGPGMTDDAAPWCEALPRRNSWSVCGFSSGS